MSELLVQFRDRLVGRAIADDTDRFSFEYASQWLSYDRAFPISLRLPLAQQSWSAAEAHPFFANLLPEGASRQAICRRLGVSVDNDAALLFAIGDDTAIFIPEKPSLYHVFSNSILNPPPPTVTLVGLRITITPVSYFPGARPKTSAVARSNHDRAVRRVISAAPRALSRLRVPALTFREAALRVQRFAPSRLSDPPRRPHYRHK